MLHKYKIFLFHSFCSLCFLLGCFFLKPFLFLNYPTQSPVISSDAIIHKQTKTTVWKEGKHRSTTTIKKELATTENIEDITHKSKGWTSITWRKNDS